MHIEEQPDIPFIALNTLIAEINYGGRVTDDKDMRLIKALLSKYLCQKVMDSTFMFTESSDKYFSPNELDLIEIKEYIKNLPNEDDPEVFGLN